MTLCTECEGGGGWGQGPTLHTIKITQKGKHNFTLTKVQHAYLSATKLVGRALKALKTHFDNLQKLSSFFEVEPQFPLVYSFLSRKYFHYISILSPRNCAKFANGIGEFYTWNDDGKGIGFYLLKTIMIALVIAKGTPTQIRKSRLISF